MCIYMDGWMDGDSMCQISLTYLNIFDNCIDGVGRNAFQFPLACARFRGKGRVAQDAYFGALLSSHSLDSRLVVYFGLAVALHAEFVNQWIPVWILAGKWEVLQQTKHMSISAFEWKVCFTDDDEDDR